MVTLQRFELYQLHTPKIHNIHSLILIVCRSKRFLANRMARVWTAICCDIRYTYCMCVVCSMLILRVETQTNSSPQLHIYATVQWILHVFSASRTPNSKQTVHTTHSTQAEHKGDSTNNTTLHKRRKQQNIRKERKTQIRQHTFGYADN